MSMPVGRIAGFLLLGLAVLAGGCSNKTVKSPKEAAQTDIANIGLVLDAYEVDCDRYPTTDEGLQALLSPPGNANNWKGPYLKNGIPQDPWGNPYVYRCPGAHNTKGYDLYSFGPNLQDGGGDDIDNWTKK